MIGIFSVLFEHDILTELIVLQIIEVSALWKLSYTSI